ncbi:hypothetical protein [Aeromicrobium sp. Leaf350]|uniref:hypothetical protein n=1 Tax=Aeromicrobium sp. Leaf350 TaxID=2876565 RepID=UPI001E4B26FC|nr:hypothetical protein [Aeromicrobium sp. Leaf350]
MPTLRHIYVNPEFEATAEYTQVSRVSDALLAHLNEDDARALLAAANLPGISSAMVQNSFAKFTDGLGFVSEAKGLFSTYENKALRPDFYLDLGSNGILMEVERGKTTTNNMDLLDVWKTHLCLHADYLFLMVPQALKHNDTMSPKKEYASVVKRLSSFFVPGNFINVRALHIFGY